MFSAKAVRDGGVDNLCDYVRQATNDGRPGRPGLGENVTPASPTMRGVDLGAAAWLVVAAACGRGDRNAASSQRDTTPMPAAASTASGAVPCVGRDATLELPPGFCATIFADSVGAARHVVVAGNGDVFVALEFHAPATGSGAATAKPPAAVIALRDSRHHGRADVVERFGARGNTGIALYDHHVYVDEGKRIVRYALAGDSLQPSTPAETIVDSIPTDGDHGAHNFVIDPRGALYLNIGSATNACQKQNRTLRSPGLDPCKELDTRAGIWRFNANKTGQTPSLAARFATGIRNGEGLAINPSDGSLWATQHGRDQLYDNWPKLFTSHYNAENPAEELVHVNRGDDFGWPYCYFAVDQKKLVLAPEYGGDGKKTARCDGKKAPVSWFPGHWAPMSLLFYTGTMFPAKYRNGAFIAFHGSWNRAPEPQAGYRVVFVPLANGAQSSAYETFADGFAGGILEPDRAAHRPVGLAQGPDGSLYITDDSHGRVWRVTFAPTH